jgi:hypothetical protein
LLSADTVEITETIYYRFISLQTIADCAIHIRQPEKKQQKALRPEHLGKPKAFHFFNLL